MAKLLGEKYVNRLVSAEYVISDFHLRRVQSEIIAYAKLCEIQQQLIEETYRRIIPGKTTSEELGWRVQYQYTAAWTCDGITGSEGTRQ